MFNMAIYRHVELARLPPCAQHIESFLMSRASSRWKSCGEEEFKIVQKRKIPIKDTAKRIKVTREESSMKSSYC